MVFQDITRIVEYVIGKDLLPKDNTTDSKAKTSVNNLAKKELVPTVDLTNGEVSLTVTARRENLKKDMFVVSGVFCFILELRVFVFNGDIPFELRLT